jgi:hypothetical protein
VRFYPVPPALALGEHPVRPDSLGPETAREDRVVVEVKHLGATLPDWLAGLTSGVSASFSKFAHGMERLHALQGNQVHGG